MTEFDVYFWLSVAMFLMALLLVVNFRKVTDLVTFAVFAGIMTWENRFRTGRHSRRITKRCLSPWYYVHCS